MTTAIRYYSRFGHTKQIEEREHGFRSLAGCWAEDHGDDDMESIIRKGREGRRGSRIIPSFDE